MAEDRPLKRIIEKQGLTQSQLARSTGVGVTQINKWCRRGWPNAASLGLLADALKCTTDALLGRSLACVSTRELLDEVARRSAE